MTNADLSLPWSMLEDRVGKALDLLALVGVPDRVGVAVLDVLLAPPRRKAGRPPKATPKPARPPRRGRKAKPPTPLFTGRIRSKNGKVRCFLDGKSTEAGAWREAIVARGIPDPVEEARAKLARVVTNPAAATEEDIHAAELALAQLTHKEQCEAKAALGIKAGHPKQPGAIGRIIEEAINPPDLRGIYAREARKAGADAKELFALARQYRRDEDQYRGEVRLMLKAARKLYRSQTGRTLTLRDDAFSTGDHTTLPGFDLVARTMADRYPELLGNHGYERGDGDSEAAAAKLRDWLIKGVPLPTREAVLYDRALAYLLERKDVAVGVDLGDIDTLADDRLARVPASWPAEPDGWPRALAGARALEGRPRELVNHPCGVALAAEPLGSLLPLAKTADARVRLTTMDADACARLGLSRLDLLSSRSLAALADGGVLAAALAVPGDSAAGEDAVAARIAVGDTAGVAHLEAPASRRILAQAAPADVRELADALALCRPGCVKVRETYLARRRGAEQVEYLHPALEPALRDTLGVLLYEDDAIGVIESLSGLNAADADRLRRLFADGDGAAGASAELLAACEARGVPEVISRQASAMLRNLESYSFCKAHALATARVAWRQMALRVSYPAAFWVACLNNHEGRFPTWVYVETAKRDGLAVLPPCVNRSASSWSQEVSALRAGLSCVLGLSDTAVIALLEDRARGGSYSGFDEFSKRVTLSQHDLAALVRAGAFDFGGRGREALLAGAALASSGLPSGRGVKVPPWPLAGFTAGTGGWELLGFACGLPLVTLARQSLPADLADSRSLRSARQGMKLRLAALVASADGPLVLLDEYGLFDAEVPAASVPEVGELVLLEGSADVRHGVAVLAHARVSGWHPGMPAKVQAGAA